MNPSSSFLPQLGGSQDRLWSLVAERCQPGADAKAIDQRIWDLFGEKWAVMFTDLSGFSRSVEAFGIIHFLQIILEQKRILLPIVAQHDGILVKVEADSFLILFRRPEGALRCAVDMQRACQRHNLERPPEEKVLLCLGIGYGDLLRIGDSDVYGREVNAASKLGEDTAKAHEILLTRDAREACGVQDGIHFEELGIAVGGSPENYRATYLRGDA